MVATNHTLILNWNSQTVPLLRQIAINKKEQGGPAYAGYCPFPAVLVVCLWAMILTIPLTLVGCCKLLVGKDRRGVGDGEAVLCGLHGGFARDLLHGRESGGEGHKQEKALLA